MAFTGSWAPFFNQESPEDIFFHEQWESNQQAVFTFKQFVRFFDVRCIMPAPHLGNAAGFFLSGGKWDGQHFNPFLDGI